MEAKKSNEATISKVVRKIREALNIGKLDDVSRWYIQRAKDKRLRRRARNISWWANDFGWK